MSKKRGFTLVEVLVVVAITSLVFALVGGTFVFLATSSGDLIDKSEELILTQTIEKHLRSLDKDNDNKLAFTSNVIWDDVTKTLTIGDTKYTDTGLSSFEIFPFPQEGSQQFIKCRMTYTKGGTYTFIIGIKQ